MVKLVGTNSLPLGEMDGNGDGIYAASFGSSNGSFYDKCPVQKCVNPSSLVLSPDSKTLFSVSETFAANSPRVISYGINQNLTLAQLSSAQIENEIPCHIAFDRHTNRLALAQYWSGEVALFTVLEDKVGARISIECETGFRRNPVRQSGPHALCIAFSNHGRTSQLSRTCKN